MSPLLRRSLLPTSFDSHAIFLLSMPEKERRDSFHIEKALLLSGLAIPCLPGLVFLWFRVGFGLGLGWVGVGLVLGWLGLGLVLGWF